MTKKIGYVIPEFPGQTHIFFWREMKVLKEMGFDLSVISTRRPPKAIISHLWAEEAMASTTYLFPFPWGEILSILGILLLAGPAKWWKCLQVSLLNSELSLKDRFKTAALIPAGAYLAVLARRKGLSHIHVHSCANAANVAMFAKIISEVPYSIMLHGPLRDYGNNQKNKWHFADFAIVITQRLMDEIHRELAAYLPPKIGLAPMGVDLKRFVRKVPYKPWDKGEKPLIFSCGRLNPCKGHDDLIKAVALLRAKGIDAILHIAGADDTGTDQYKSYLEGVIQNHNLQGNVELLGAVSEEKILKELESAHVFALASLEEPLGVAIMEGMAMNLPTIATNAGGVPELIASDEHGILVPPRNPKQLAEAIEAILISPDLATKLSVGGRQRVESMFHARKSAEVLQELLSK